MSDEARDAIRKFLGLTGDDDAARESAERPAAGERPVDRLAEAQLTLQWPRRPRHLTFP